MLRLQSNITFTKSDGRQFIFDFCHKVDTSESWNNHTSTAEIVLPRKISFEGKNLFVGNDAIFKRGDQVKIELGYFPKLRTVFEGYLSKVGSNIPVVLQCEDQMFTLKNTRCTYPKKRGLVTTGKNGRKLKKPKVTSSAITLNNLLGNILPDDIKYECLDVNLGMRRYTDISVSAILDDLKTTFGIYSYFRQGKLYVGFPSNAAISNTEEFAFEQTIINENDLDWQQKEDMILKVLCVSIDSKTNAKTEVEVGDSDGAQRTYHYVNTSKADLTKFANLKLNEVKYTGFVGKVDTFGEPYMRQGDIAKISSKKLPERDGNYLVETVKRKFGVGVGYREYLELNHRV